MSDFVWPQDLAFLTLARKLGDAVALVVNRGERVAPVPGNALSFCMCPLGALMVMEQPSWRGSLRPAAVTVLSHVVWPTNDFSARPDVNMLRAFMNGFDHGYGSLSDVPAIRASGELGIWYRRRFWGKGRLRGDRSTPRSRRKREAQKIDGPQSSR